LTLLDESVETWTFQTFDDDRDRKAPELVRILHGTLAEHAAELADLSGRGAGVFVTVNETDGKGRTAKNITRVRAVTCDTDGAPLDPIMRCGLEPTFVVESSPGRWHVYWNCDGLPLKEFSGLNAAIAAKFDSDPSITGLPGVLRLTGFPHQKGEPFAVRVFHESGGVPYSADMIRKAFPVGESAPCKATPGANGRSAIVVVEAATIADIRNALAHLRADDRALWMGVAHDLHELGDVGRGLWIAWSQMSDQWKPSDAKQWDTIKDARSGYRNVFVRAGAAGWLNGAARPGRSMVTLASDAGTPMFPTSNSTAGETSSLCVVEIGDIYSAVVAPPSFVVDRIIPRGVVTLLGGHGGIGKSMLALIIAVCVAAGRPWAGFGVTRGRVVFVSLEDSADIVRWRLSVIVRALNIDLALLRGNLMIVDGTGGEGALVTERSEAGVRRLAPTVNFPRFLALTEGVALVVLDNCSDAYDADENQRRQVRAFVRMLTQIARANDGAVLALAHIDKAAAKFGAQGNSYSGSSAWNNSVRSREALVESDGAIELRHEKSNFSKKADPIRMTFGEHGMLFPAEGGMAGECDDDARLLHCMSTAIARGDVIGTARVGAGTSLACARTLPGFPASLKAPARFWAALGRLESTGALRREEFTNANRKVRQRWAVCAEALNAQNTGLEQ
jgi:hypothetical protein